MAQTEDAQAPPRVIGEAWVLDKDVVEFIVSAESEDGSVIGDTRDVVTATQFGKLGFKLDAELTKTGDRARILAP